MKKIIESGIRGASIKLIGKPVINSYVETPIISFTQTGEIIGLLKNLSL